MTINLFSPPKETPAQIEIMQKPEENLLAEFQQGKIIDHTLLQTNNGFSRMLIEYEAGQCIQKEYVAGAFLKSCQPRHNLLRFRPVDSRSTRSARRI